jgi:hypothetical protein
MGAEPLKAAPAFALLNNPQPAEWEGSTHEATFHIFVNKTEEPVDGEPRNLMRAT